MLEFLAHKKDERREERRKKIENKKKARDDEKNRKKDSVHYDGYWKKYNSNTFKFRAQGVMETTESNHQGVIITREIRIKQLLQVSLKR